MLEHRLLTGILGTAWSGHTDKAIPGIPRFAIQWLGFYMARGTFARFGGCGTRVKTVGICRNAAICIILCGCNAR
jgi:hypothetical protein